MARKALAIGSVALCGLLGACSHDEGAPPDAQAIAKQLHEAEAQWNRDYATHKVAGLVSHYSPDAAMANPGAELARGTAQIRAADTQFMSDPSVQLQFASDRVLVAQSGELASTRGHYTVRSTDPRTHKPRMEDGIYLTVWQKQSDGSWKAVEDFVTPGPQVQPAR
jgi:ketosteroid isomerase-like protein